MKQVVCYAVVMVLLVLAVLPSATSAQRLGRSSSDGTSTSTSRLYQDGSSESSSSRRERVRMYRQQSSELQQKINALSSTAVTSVLMPVLFGVGIKDISPNFGDPRSGGARTHEGEDIMAVKGTPIVSPTEAIVLRTVTDGAGEGNAVYTANPGGETFVYMHLDRFGEGVTSGTHLDKGSLIGYVGNTGNASGGPAHLHFEIHNSGDAVDPFPRLTGEFSLKEKISYLATILKQTSNDTTFSRFLVTNFRGTFIAALAANISLPLPIIDALASIPAAFVPALAVEARPLPPGDLDIGSSGVAVTALQKYLIQAASGAATTRLADAGATGYFGAITKAALVEYQVAVGISVPSGYYGPTTRAFITAHPSGVSESPAPSSPSVVDGTATLTRDLYLNVSGEDVRTLQRVLNANGYAVAPTGLDSTGSPRAGSPGNETIYFGPATQAAVIRLQIALNVSPAAGYVGPLTRAALAAL